MPRRSSITYNSKLSQDESRRDSENSKFELRKKIGIWSAISILSGTIVGSGIFISPAGVLESTNMSVGISLIVWLSCGLLALLSALCYAELGTSITESGCDFVYNRVAYGAPVGFMYAWSSILIVRTTGNAALAITFGTYLVQPFFPGNCEPPVAAVKCAGCCLVMAVTALNYVSVKATNKIQNLFTLGKFSAMLIIIVGGLVELGLGNPVGRENFANAFDPDILAGLSFTQIGFGFYEGLFSYDGWNNLNFAVEEVKEAHKTVPRAIIISVLLVTGFYVLVNVAYLSALTPAEMVASEAVALSFGHRVLGSYAWIMPLTVCLSTAGSINGSFLSGCRMPFVAARCGQWPQIFKMVHVRYYTPVPSILLNSAITLLFIIPGDFTSLIYAFSFTAWTFYGLSALAIIILRITRPNLPRPYKIPLIIPVLVIIAALYLVIAPIVASPALMYLYAVLFIIGSLLVYYPFVHKKIQVSALNSVTKISQLVLDVAPTEWEDLKW